MKLLVNSTCFVEIDDEDVSIYLSRSWREQKSKKVTYVACTADRTLLHRVIMNVTDPNIQVDHKDGNGLNNRKANLRLVNTRTNAQNNHQRREGNTSSKYIGVTKSHNSWRVRVWTKETGHICLGSYDSEEVAARVYDNYMIKHFTPETRGTLNYDYI